MVNSGKGDAIENLKRSILEDYPRMTEDDTFQFACGRNASCFTQCCADVNIALTPYDILRMKNRLGIDSGEFLDRYTIIPFSRSQNFPVVFLRMKKDARKACHFVTDEGCQVYSDRPWACRMYPVGQASPKHQDEERFFFILEEDPCEGHGSGPCWTVRSWMDDQGVAEYDSLGDEFKQITLHEFFQKGGTLSASQMDMLCMVLYDLDRFRRFVFDSSFLDKFKIGADLVRRAREDDVALLRLGFQWLRFCLFGEHSIEIQDAVKKTGARDLASPKKPRKTRVRKLKR
jgi:Fe-S-cluster containining protein